MTIPMTATKKLTYAGKRLAAEDDFDAKSKGDARLLAAIGKAKYRTTAVMSSPVQKEQGPLERSLPKQYGIRNAPPPPADDLPQPGDILAPLREEYQRVLGKKPYHGWDAETLREKIDAHIAAPAAEAE